MRGSATAAQGLRTASVWTAALLSGAAALAYEVSWSRTLVIPLGNSADAATLVLAGFMLGLALGAGLGGDRAERVGSPLALYGLLEGGLAVAALVLPVGLRALVWLPPLLRYPAALLLVAAPCLMMGATFPLLLRGLARDGGELGLRVGVTYGVNTLGAALGACLTGFFGVARVGVAGCSRAGAVASVLAAGLALAAALGDRARRRMAARLEGRTSAAPREEPPPAEPELPPALVLGVAGLGGFVMLAAEVLWARVLTFVFGHDTYAFASLLALVLVGLALGGFGQRLLPRGADGVLLTVLPTLLGLLLLASYGIAATLVVAQGRDPFGLDASGRLATSPWLELARELVLTPVLVLPAAIVAGALLPAVGAAHARGHHDPGRRVGTVVLANGVGATLGAVSASWALGPRLAIHDGFRLLAALSVAGGAAVAMLAGRGRARTTGVVVPLVALTAALLCLPPALPRRLLLAAVGPRHQTLLHYEEGRTATVSVIENQLNGERQLVINAVNEVTTRLVHDQSFALLGHLGPLLHPAPRRAVMICLGAGLSAGAAATHPLERLDVVDLSSAVARGARHFVVENGGVLSDPVLRLHIDDGRRFLLDAPGAYDLAIIDSTHPKAVDSWILYTREFYALVRERLAPGGIVVQWVPLHGLSEQEFKIIARTFLTELPSATLWANVGWETYGQVGYAKLVARRDGPVEIDLDRLDQRLAAPRVRASLARYGLDEPSEILAAWVGGPAEIEQYTRGVPVQTDDRPLVAYTTEWSRGPRMVPRLLLGASGSSPPAVGTPAPRARVCSPVPHPGIEGGGGSRCERAARAEQMVRAGRLERARELAPDSHRLALYAHQRELTRPYYEALAARYPDDPSVLYEAGTQLGTLGHPEAALVVLARARALAPRDFRIALHYALALRATGDARGALAVLEELRRQRWDAPLVHQNLGAILLDAGEPGVASNHLRTALELEPGSASARLALAGARLAAGDPGGARELLEPLVAADQAGAEAQALLARAALALGDCHAARRSADRSRRLDPTVGATHRLLGEALECLGDARGAEAAFAAALGAEPADPVSLGRLGALLVRRGEIAPGLARLLAALELAPDSAELAAELGVALRRAGRRAEAVGALCLALRLAPGLSAARRELLALHADEDACASSTPPDP